MRIKNGVDARGTFDTLFLFSMGQTLFMSVSSVLFGITAWTYNRKLEAVTGEVYTKQFKQLF